MRTRFAAIPAALIAAALALAGCSSGSSTPSSSSGPVTLTVSYFAGSTSLPPLIKLFEKANKGVTVNYIGLPYPQILTQINTQLVSGTASDVVTVFPGQGNPIAVQTLSKNGYLADLSAQSWTKNFSATKKQVMGVKGKVYFASDNLTIIPAIYNKQALAEVGATPPTTWNDVLALCATAKAKNKVAYALGGIAGSDIQFYLYALSSSLVYGPSPQFGAEQAAGKTSFASSKWTTAFTKLEQMQQAGCFSADTLGVSLDTSQTQVAQGAALGLVTVSNQLPTIEGKAAAGTTFVTAPLPATNKASDTYLPVGLGAGLGVNAKSKNLAIAKKFVEFYMSKEGVESAITSGSIFPSVPVGDFKHDAALDGVLQQASGNKTTSFPDSFWPNSSVQQTLFSESQKLLGGSASVSDVVAALDGAYKG